MSYNLEIYPEVRDMLLEIEAYHNHQNPGSGSELLVSFLDTLEKIEDNPFQYQIRYDNIRAAAVRIKTYKYFILYEVLKNNIIVIKFVSQASDWMPI